MAVYRFKVTFEDDEDVYREIDIKSSQHFEDFHNVIVQSIGFDNKHNASFYISDDQWHKGDEITLRPTEQAEVDARKKADLTPKKQMSKCKLLSLIDDPHQKFVYVYDLKTSWTFLVELMKIVPDDEKSSYPKCTKSIGESPKQYISTAPVPVVEDDDMEEEDEKAKLIDAIAYTATEEEDTALLEGEEGEDVAADEEDDLAINDFDEGAEEEPGAESFEED